MSEITKIQAQKEFQAGKLTKAELARKYNVSPRTIGRWTEGLKASTKTVAAQPTTTDLSKAKKPAAATTLPKKFTQEALHKLSPVDPEDWKPEDDSALNEEIEANAEYSVVATSKSISITKVVDGKLVGSMSASQASPLFKEVLAEIMASGLSQSVLASSYIKLQPAEAIKFVSEGKLTVDVKKGIITYNSQLGPVEVHNSLANRIVESLKKEGALSTMTSTLLKFLDNLMLNPSFRAINELYGFLEATDIELTEDGHFLAWKRVRNDYLDIHSGTMSNKPGTTLRVPRNQVDENSERTCSHGLHVCSKSYLPSFGGGQKVVQVMVHPADVVAIPRDYKNAKLRCCGYEVLKDVTNSNVWK